MRRLTSVFVVLAACAPQETAVAVVPAQSPIAEVPAPASSSAPPVAVVAAPPRSTTPPPAPTVAPRAAPLASATAPSSPSLLDPMDPCLPRALDAHRPAPRATVDRAGLVGELRWAKTRAEICCPRVAGSTQVTVTVASSGVPQTIALAGPAAAPPGLPACIRKLYFEIRVDPWTGGPAVEKSDVSTASSTTD